MQACEDKCGIITDLEVYISCSDNCKKLSDGVSAKNAKSTKKSVAEDLKNPMLKSKSDKLIQACEEVTEQYTICNGARYVRDLKSYDGFKRDMKKIDDTIEKERPLEVRGVSK